METYFVVLSFSLTQSEMPFLLLFKTSFLYKECFLAELIKIILKFNY